MSETQDDLEGVERTMDETADSAGNSAEELEGFSQKFKGAMGAAISALAVGSAGLLSQVPIVGEAFSGLSAIVDELIFKIDDDLRPSLSGFRDDLFETAADVGEADSSLEAFRTALDGVGQAIQDTSTGQLQQEIQDLTGITVPENWLDLGWDIITMDARNAVDTLTSVVKDYPEDFGTFLESIAPKAGREYNKLVTDTRNWVNDLIDEVEDFPSDVRTFFTNLATDLNTWADDLATDAREWGVDLIESFTDGIEARLSGLRDFLSDLRNLGGEVGVSVPSLGGVGGSGGDGGGSGGGAGRAYRSTSSGGAIAIDGRNLAESTGRYRAGPSRRRGQ
ncbi:tape measure [Halorubrum tailed virus 4]|uniref:Tape measure n=1 Tax=Halorubrum tailed virus 4 TaxID=1273752 RepID=R4T8F8_9CAUD|nr:tape measure [Halorubrum tailed virus 4]AGM11160.1 tape measure [Halorubrum tailed virus 4]